MKESRVNTLSNTIRHLEKYVVPYLDIEDGPLVLARNLKDERGREFEATSTVVPIGGKIQTRKARVLEFLATIDGTETYVPITAIQKNTALLGKHRDEGAVAAMWGHFKGMGGYTPIDAEKAVEEARSDPQHPLHISNADRTCFNGNCSNTALADESYYNNLKSSAYCIEAMRVHPDLAPYWTATSQMTLNSAKYYPLTEFYEGYGVKAQAGVSKSDLLVLQDGVMGLEPVSLSLKGAFGSQIASSSPSEAEAIMRYAVDETRSLSLISSSESADIHLDLDVVLGHMRASEIKEADAHLMHMFNEVYGPLLTVAIIFEAASGIGKFGAGSPGIAKYLVTFADIRKPYVREKSTVEPLTRNTISNYVHSNRMYIQGIRAPKSPHQKNPPPSFRIVDRPRNRDYQI